MARVGIILILFWSCLFLPGFLLADNPATLDLPSSLNSKTPIDKGGIVLSGNAQITFGGGDLYADQIQIAFQPSILAFIVKRFAVGADVAIIYNNYENDDDLQLAVGPSFALFMGSGHEKAMSFIEFSPRYTRKEVNYVQLHYDPYWGNYTDVRRVELEGVQLAGAIGVVNLVGKSAAITVATGFTYDILSRDSISLNGYYLGVRVGLAMFLY